MLPILTHYVYNKSNPTKENDPVQTFKAQHPIPTFSTHFQETQIMASNQKQSSSSSSSPSSPPSSSSSSSSHPPTSADIKAFLKARAQKEVNEALAKGETPHPFAVIQARTGKLAVADDFQIEDKEEKEEDAEMKIAPAKDAPTSKPNLSWMVVPMNTKLIKTIREKYYCPTVGNEMIMGELGFEILDAHSIKLPNGWTTTGEMCPNGEHYFHFPIAQGKSHEASIYNRRAVIDRNGKMTYFEAPTKKRSRKEKHKPESSTKRARLQAKLVEEHMTPVEFADNLATAIDDDKPDLARLQSAIMDGLVIYCDGLSESDFDDLTRVKVVP